MRPKRLLFFMTVLLVLLAMPVLAIDIVLEGDRKVTAEEVTYENGKFRIVTNTATFDVQASKVKFLEVDDTNKENLRKENIYLKRTLDGTEQAKKKWEEENEKLEARVTELESMSSRLMEEITDLMRDKYSLTTQLEKAKRELGSTNRALAKARSSLKQAVRKSTQVAPEWELVSTLGFIKFVYMSPAGLKDKYFIAQALNKLVDKNWPAYVRFFDDKKFTPLSHPMTDSQLLHLRAEYIWNANNQFEGFTFYELTDPYSSPPDHNTIEANIRPGYAE